MSDKIHLDQLVIVEGKYDKVKLENLVDALIIITEGFSIFKDREKSQFIKSYASQHGAVIITDSDSAGFLIRKHLSDILAGATVTDVYLPDVFGKEPRKTKPSKEGKLGLEGLSDSVVLKALQDSGVATSSTPVRQGITATTLFELGLSGTANSKEKLQRLLTSLDLPTRLSKTALLRVLNTRFTLEEFLEFYKNNH